MARVQGYVTLVSAGALLLALLLLRKRVRRELAADLRSLERAFTVFILARLGQIAFPDASPSLQQGMRFVAVLFGVVGVVRLAETAFFAWVRRSTPRIVRSLVAWVSMFIVAAVVLREEYRFNLESIFATSALLSVVLGFALQETLGNLFAGLTLNAEQPFEPGEWVSFGKYTGRVLDVGWRSTRLVTLDEDEILVPNGLISREVVVNHMRPQTSDVIELTVGVDLDVSPARAKQVLVDAVKACPLVLKQPEPTAQMQTFTADGVNYRLKFYTEGFHVERQALDQVQQSIWYALRRASIEMPYPQRTISVRERAAEAEERRRKEHLAEAEDLLGRIDFVQALSAPARKVLAERARFMEYGPQQAVVRQGEQGDTLYLVARGEVAVRVMLEGGEKEVARLGRGALFGEMSVLTGEPRTATVVSLGDSALLAVDRDAFERILSAEPDLAQRLAETIARRRMALDAARAEKQSPQMEKETSNLLGRIRNIFGFKKTGT